MYFEGAKKQACNYDKNALLQVFFQELGQNLRNSYFKELLPIYVKQKPQPLNAGVNKSTHLNLEVVVALKP